MAGSACRGAERPLRVAVAGPHIVSAEALARAVTRLAADHGVGGRVVTAEGDDSGSLAIWLDVPTPFKDNESASEEGSSNGCGRSRSAVRTSSCSITAIRSRLPLPEPDQHERPSASKPQTPVPDDCGGRESNR